jgi:hypothetical protein
MESVKTPMYRTSTEVSVIDCAAVVPVSNVMLSEGERGYRFCVAWVSIGRTGEVGGYLRCGW